MSYRRPHRASLKALLIAVAVYLAVLVSISVAWHLKSEGWY